MNKNRDFVDQKRGKFIQKTKVNIFYEKIHKIKMQINHPNELKAWLTDILDPL